MSKQNIDWSNLGFGYIKTDYRYVCRYKDGQWDEGGLETDANITLNECACVFQYCQACFEGMKAYYTKDGHIVCFRPDMNAKRMAEAAEHVKTGTVTYAVRDSEYDGKRIKKGEIMALENGKIVSTSNDITKATYRLARGMCKKDSSFVTIISGCDVSDEDAEKLTEIVKAKCPNHVEVSHIRGGQPVYYYMISVE